MIPLNLVANRIHDGNTPALVPLTLSFQMKLQHLYLASTCLLLHVKFAFPLSLEVWQRPQLFQYQREGVERLVDAQRVLLADEMGLGKTVQCIAAIDKLCKNDTRMSVLIVCPKSVMGVWESELDRWLESPLILQIASPKSFPPPSDRSITLINYDICYKFRDLLHTQKYHVLICDEAHYLKSLTAKRTLAVLGNDKQANPGIQAEYTWLLTGTPVLNRPVELYPLLRAIAPDQFADFDTFVNRYCNPKPAQRGRFSVMDYSGASNLPELSQRLEPHMLRRYKMDILTQLPPKFRCCVCLTGSHVAQLERERLRSIVAATSASNTNPDLENFGSEASDLMTYLGKCADLDLDDPANRNRVMGSLATVRMETALAKVDPAIELLQDILLLQKVVLFAHHREVILALMERFGDQAVCVMGGTDMTTRSSAVRRFQEDPNVRIFVGSIRAAGVGLTLTAASHVVFLELDWSPGVMSQAEDRCHRVGQLDSVQVQYYVFKDTIDEWIAKSLLYKQSTIDQILPEKLAGVESGYSFDFGKHEGQRLEDVPRNYVQFLVRNEVWRHRPALWRALFLKGIVLEEPPQIERDEKVVNATSAPSEITREIEYVFDFGKHNGKKWSEVPENYRNWIIKEGIWKSRAYLKTSLSEAGHILEDQRQ